MNLLGSFGKSTLPSIIKDPFSKQRVKSICVNYYEQYSGNWMAWGTVEFTNGNTSGKQKFGGDSFDDVVGQIKTMIENLD
jgi:hypothetical protein